LDFISCNRDEPITHQIRRVVGNDGSFSNGFESFINCTRTTCRSAYLALVHEIISVSYMKRRRKNE
jgi:hypothetical protein